MAEALTNALPAWRATHGPADADRYRAHGWWTTRSHLDDLLDVIARYPDKPAIVATHSGSAKHRRLSFGDLGDLIDRCAAVYLDLGVVKGDIVSIQLCNGWQFPVAALGAMRVGAIPHPIPPIYRDREVGFMLRHARSKLFVGHDMVKDYDHAALAARLLAGVPTLRHCLIVGAAPEGCSTSRR